MRDPVLLTAVAGIIEAARYAVAAWLAWSGERARDRAVLAVILATGPGTSVTDCRPDGAVLAVRRNRPVTNEAGDGSE